MTNQEQMITPPQLVEQWIDMLSSRSDYAVFSLAAQWGWDQHRAATESELQQARDEELNECCEWLDFYSAASDARDLRLARRPEPPSLRKQAYNALDTYVYGSPDPKDKERTYNTIRRALEQLND